MSKVDKIKKPSQLPTISFWIATSLWLLSFVFFVIIFEVFEGRQRAPWFALAMILSLATTVISIVATVANKSLVLRAVSILCIAWSLWQFYWSAMSTLLSMGGL